MHIAITAATPYEIQPLVDYLNKTYPSIYANRYQVREHQVSIWITGVGMLATAVHLGRWLAQTPTQWLLNAGIAGSFRRDWALGTVVQVASDRLGDCGVEDANAHFTDIFDMGLTDPNEPPFINGRLYNTAASEFSFLPAASALTVNRVTGTAQSVEAIAQKYQADIETMEGAAVHYVCLLNKVPFLQIRAISNYVEPRNKANWNIALAIEKLNEVLVAMLEE